MAISAIVPGLKAGNFTVTDSIESDATLTLVPDSNHRGHTALQ
jgi:hypothetical protein